MPVRHMVVIVAALLAIIVQVGAASAASPFVGHWKGPWHDEHGQSGVFTLDIDEAGAVKGDVTNADMHGSVDGKISAGGDLDATYKYGVIPYKAKAHLSLGGGHLRGFAHYALPLGVPMDEGPIDLERQ